MFDKITDRIKKLCYGLNEMVDAVKVAMRVIEGLYDGVTTSELDNLAAETCAYMVIYMIKFRISSILTIASWLLEYL